MSKAEILAELPKLRPDERAQVFQKLCELQEDDLVRGAGPSPEEKALLDEALAGYERDGDAGKPWREVLHRIRSEQPR
jgi:hypothetical protein